MQRRGDGIRMDLTTPYRPVRGVPWWRQGVRLLTRVWRWLPAVRPYTGPDSLAGPPGTRVQVFNGRVLITPLRKTEPRDGTPAP